MRPVTALLAVSLVVALAGSTPSRALETDQFFAWGKPLADSTDVLNRQINGEIGTAIGQVSAASSTCADVERAVASHLKFFIFQQLENWAVSSSEVDRVPRTAEEVEEFRKSFLYGPRPGNDPILWLPASPTVEAAGVRFGTDKLSHFFSQGLNYHKSFLHALSKGATPAEAERHAIEIGLTIERMFLGFEATGVFSVADLEANDSGMRFWNSLCEGPQPIVAKGKEGWAIARPFDLRDYVNPGWDESWRPNVFRKRRWKRVRPAMERYCPLLDAPQVQERRRRYREADRVTPTWTLIREQVARGKLADPRKFSIETVCGRSP